MTTIKLLSAGLIAIVALTTSAGAHEKFIAAPHIVPKGDASANSATRPWIFSHARIAGESNTAPQTQPGGVCDVGDNPAIC
jgi:hypothetical protein